MKASVLALSLIASCAAVDVALAAPDEKVTITAIAVEELPAMPVIVTPSGDLVLTLAALDIDAGPPPDAAIIAGVEVPDAPQITERALAEGLEGDRLAMVVGFVIIASMALRAALPALRANRIVGWAVNGALTAGSVLFVYLANDMPITATVLFDIGKGVLLAAGGWQAAKGVAPDATKTAGRR